MMRLLALSLLLCAVGPIAAHAGAAANAARQSCLGDLGHSAQVCGCIAGKVETELNAGQQKLFLAILARDASAQNAARATMSVNDMAGVAKFMNNTPRKCGA